MGLCLGYKWGSGVLITHILDEDGKEAWSTPVLYQIHELSLGLLAGLGLHQSIPHALHRATMHVHPLTAVAPSSLHQPSQGADMRASTSAASPECAPALCFAPRCAAGVGNIQTLLILGSERAVDQFRAGAKGPVVLGQDLSLGQSLGFDVIEDRNIFARRDILTHSLADGAIVDWSLIGGAPVSLSAMPFCNPGNSARFHCAG